MTGSRALTLLGLLVTAGAWLASGVVARRALPPGVPPPFPVTEIEVSQSTARLAKGLEALSPPRGGRPYTRPVRNPFAFGEPVGAPAAAKTIDGRSHPARIGDGDASDRPIMQLTGMAEDPGAEGPVRRAVITAAGQLFVVGKGDSVLNRFRVVRLDAEVVELEDAQGGPAVILALR